MNKYTSPSNFSHNYSHYNTNTYINTSFNHYRLNSNNEMNQADKCLTHKESFIKYCMYCSSDLCKQCLIFHRNHTIINLADIIPDKEEINLLKSTIKTMNEDYSKLLEEITKWKNKLEEKILNLERLIEKNEIINDIDFVENYKNLNPNFSNINKFREIYSCVISPEMSKKNELILKSIKNNKKYNMSYYNYGIYKMSKSLLDNLKNMNNNINENFIYMGNIIINYLSNTFNKTAEDFKISPKSVIRSKRYYNTGTYNGPLRLNDEDNFFFKKSDDRTNSNKQNKIIEKYIDLKTGLKTKSLNKINSNFSNEQKYNSGFDNPQKRTLLTSYSTKNLFSTTKKFNQPTPNNNIYHKLISYTPMILNPRERIYSKKNINCPTTNELNETDINMTRPFELKNDNEFNNNSLNNSQSNNEKKHMKINIPKKKNYIGRTNSSKFYSTSTFNPENMSNKLLNKEIYNDKKKEQLEKKYVPELKSKKLIYPSYTKQNIGTMKKNIIQDIKEIKLNKFDLNHNQEKPINNNNDIKHKENEYDLLNQTEIYNKENNNLEESALNESAILNSTFTQSYTNNYLDVEKNIVISKKDNINDKNIYFTSSSQNNNVKSSIFNDSNAENYKKNIKIVKHNQNTKYIVNPNEKLCIGLDFDNCECKLSLVNQLNGDIELFCFDKEKYSIPTMISFNEKGEAMIGSIVDNSRLLFPSNTFYNLIRMIGKNYEQIKGIKEIWPFKLYPDKESGRPFVKLSINKKDKKKYFIEDLINIFLKKLFNLFFQKIIVNEDSDKNDNVIKLNIILVVTVPNDFTYFQRQVLLKIFEKQIFPQSSNQDKNFNKYKKLYNNYQINLKKIKIENSSSISTLCLKGAKQDNKNNNTLILNIGGGSVNLSITSIKEKQGKNIYEVKALHWGDFGEEDFIDYYLDNCLKEFGEKKKKECMNNPGALAKLRKSCSMAKQYFEKGEQIEIGVNNLIGNTQLRMILNKNDYEEVCKELYERIGILVKEILKKSKLSAINIENILLIGSTTRTNKVKNILKDIFKHNRLLYTKLSYSSPNDIDNDFFVVIGAAIQASNLSIKEPKYILNDIAPMSFGIETLNNQIDIIIQKGTSLPAQKEKFVKIKNDDEEYLEIKFYEGDNNIVDKNRMISSARIDKKNFKSEKVEKDFIELLIRFELDSKLNLCVFVLDVKTHKKRFECLIDVEIII